ncbi:NADH kinase POS5, mitochondrial [Candida viswanathii]|uniref:NADH kinase POS5, mitochondrial n=1 Tax=Candida viswanathii TaxID=5486 RepID=A0A367XXC8_9ASCO|nr:NADH kinase POS5, mitochondrial [Candida viswanathii]
MSLTPQGAQLLSIKQCSELPKARLPEYIKSSKSRLYNVIWRASPPTNVYIAKKPWEPSVHRAMIEFINHLHKEYPSINIIVNEDVAEELREEYEDPQEETRFDTSVHHVIYTGKNQDIVDKTELMVTLGGDGTILHGASLFLNVNVPPVLSFAMGTLGFLLPFNFKNFQLSFKEVYESRSKALHRNRLECHVIRKNGNGKQDNDELHPKKKYKVDQGRVVDVPDTDNNSREMIHAMNDVTIHRASLPNLTSLDIYIDNEFFTTTFADGVILATPTGSTAYSLSAGGSITHPAVPCILLTPICPRSLSFRPLILPSLSDIMVKLSENNRNNMIELTIDGIAQPDLHPGDELHITSEDIVPGADLSKTNAKNGIWCVATHQNQWAKDLNSLLGFNSLFRDQKGKKLHL